MALSGLTHLRSGKVRDIYEVGADLLIVASDRISAFDWVLPDEIIGKGKVLTSLSLFWFGLLGPEVRHHLISSNVDEMPEAVRRHSDYLSGRSMLVHRTSVIPIECVVRGYLAGSGWKEYKNSGRVCGIELPGGLRDSDRLPQPIFTPATKEESGHDINVSFDEAAARVGIQTMEFVRNASLRIYAKAATYALSRGIIIADTKFEFGKLPDGTIILIDEILTPDSSRFWPQSSYAPGKAQPSFDKQIVRDYLETISWDKASPPPHLPGNVIQRTIRKYEEVRDLLIR
ncbi:MAG: phosphoribosylaminoimidazolesuccinocarboxamide synthase [Candidatus Brocadiia bacterium]